MSMETVLALENMTVMLASGLLAIASFSSPSWGVTNTHGNIHEMAEVHQAVPPLAVLLKGYEPPDNGKPDHTGDTGGR